MCKCIFMERIELHEIYMLLGLFLPVFTEYLLHTRTSADGQKFPHPIPVPIPSLLALGAKGRRANLPTNANVGQE